MPALAVAGAALPVFSAQAGPAPTHNVDDLTGARIFNVRDFGAKGDGKTLNTKAIQPAIDACNKESGGTVLIPAGDFICGTVELKSNVTLHLLARGAIVRQYSSGYCFWYKGIRWRDQFLYNPERGWGCIS